MPQTPAREVYNAGFQWKLTIPAGFDDVDSAELAQAQNKGARAIEQTYNNKVENHTTPLFVFKSGRFNRFESNRQPFDVAKDGDYRRSCKNVDEILYQTLKAQSKGAKIDTSYSSETIDKVVFEVFSLKMNLGGGHELDMLLYGHLFNRQELSVSVGYLDADKGTQMLSALRRSTFGSN